MDPTDFFGILAGVVIRPHEVAVARSRLWHASAQHLVAFASTRRAARRPDG